MWGCWQSKPPGGGHALPTMRGVRPVPTTTITAAGSFNYLVRERKQSRWNGEAQRFRSLQVDHQIELGRLDNGKLGRLSTFGNFSGIDADLPIYVWDRRSVADEATSGHELARMKHHRHSVPCSKRYKLITLILEIRVCFNHNSVRPQLSKRGKRHLDLMLAACLHNRYRRQPTSRGLRLSTVVPGVQKSGYSGSSGTQ